MGKLASVHLRFVLTSVEYPFTLFEKSKGGVVHGAQMYSHVCPCSCLSLLPFLHPPHLLLWKWEKWWWQSTSSWRWGDGRLQVRLETNPRWLKIVLFFFLSLDFCPVFPWPQKAILKAWNMCMRIECVHAYSPAILNAPPLGESSCSNH